MFEQRIAKHALNRVLEISKLIPFSLSSKKKNKKKTFLCLLIKVPLFTGHGLREKSTATV